MFYLLGHLVLRSLICVNHSVKHPKTFLLFLSLINNVPLIRLDSLLNIVASLCLGRGTGLGSSFSDKNLQP